MHLSEASDQSTQKIVIYTHGQAEAAHPPANFDADAQNEPITNMLGSGISYINCAAQKLHYDVEWRLAPLSRARLIMRSEEQQFWFPASAEGSRELDLAFSEPFGKLEIYWYIRQNETVNPYADIFKDNALVTVYHGSSLASELSGKGYHLITGSADHRLLLEMLLARRVDGILAIDFRHLLPMSTMMRFQDGILAIKDRVLPIGLAASKGVSNSNPQLLEALNEAILACKEKLDPPSP